MSFDHSQDYFAYFDLPRAYAMDRNLLESRYLERSKQFHPDRVHSMSEHDKRIAMERSSAINVAYQTLRDPVKRAEYLVKLGGIDLNSSEPEHGAPTPDQAFLISMLDLREELEQAQASGLLALEELRERIQKQGDTHMKEAISAFETNAIPQAAQALVAHRYLQRFLQELDSLNETDPGAS